MEIPQQYQLYLWRKKMNVSWSDMLNTPMWVIQQDMEMSNLEAEFRPRPKDEPKAKMKKRY